MSTISSDSLQWLIKLHEDKQVLLEGNVLKFIDKSIMSDEQLQYLNKAVAEDRKKIQDRIDMNTEIRTANIELSKTKQQLEILLDEANVLKTEAETAKNNAMIKLDDFLQKSRSELVTKVVIYLIWFIGALSGTSAFLFYIHPDNSVISNLVSQIFVSALSSAFGIIGTLFGIREAMKSIEGRTSK